jgi:hypothetical protein
MSLTKLSLAGNNLIIPDQGEFGLYHPGWGRENRYSQTLIFRHPFFRKQCFSLKYSLVSSLKIFEGMSKFGIYVIMKSSLQFKQCKGLKKLLSACVEVTSALPNSDTQKDLLM